MSALTPRQIAEFVYAEHSPLATMSMEETIDHIEKLINETCKEYHEMNKALEYNEICKNSHIGNYPESLRKQEPWPLSISAQ